MKDYSPASFEIRIGRKKVRVGVRIWRRLDDMRRHINRKYPKDHNGRMFIAYAETYRSKSAAGYIGTIHLAKSELSTATITHESIHIASGIMSVLFPKAWFQPTWKRADYNEECFADIVGVLSERTHRIAKEYANTGATA
jgi:hypothetical protein